MATRAESAGMIGHESCANHHGTTTDTETDLFLHTGDFSYSWTAGRAEDEEEND